MKFEKRNSRAGVTKRVIWAVVVWAMGASAVSVVGQEATGSVSGRVVQEAGGEGIRKATVMLDSEAEGGSHYVTATNASGEFRFEGVKAGQYNVAIERAGYVLLKKKAREMQVAVTAGQEVAGLAFKMAALGVIAGKVVDGDGDPLFNAAVQATAVGGARGRRDEESGQNSAVTNDVGEFRIANLRAGQYLVVVGVPGNQTPVPNPVDKGKTKQRVGFVTTFYPGATDEKLATPVQVTPGGTTTVNITLQTSGTYRVSGTVMGVANAKDAQIVLMSVNGRVEQGPIGEGGKFEFPDMPTGTYAARVVETGEGTEGSRGRPRISSVATAIVVNGADVTGLVLQTEANGSVSGRFRMDDDSSMDWTKLFVSLRAVPEGNEDEHTLGMMASTGAAMMKADGSFELPDLAAGTYQLVVGERAEEFRSFYTKQVLLSGRDVTDSGFVVNGATVVEAVMSAKGATIEGTVEDEEEQPVTGATVVSVPGSGQRARPDSYQMAVTDAKGHFTMRGLNPGEFILVALGSVDLEPWSAEFFQQYSEKGRKIEVGEGEKKYIGMRMVGE